MSELAKKLLSEFNVAIFGFGAIANRLGRKESPSPMAMMALGIHLAVLWLVLYLSIGEMTVSKALLYLLVIELVLGAFGYMISAVGVGKPKKKKYKIVKVDSEGSTPFFSAQE